MQQPTGDGAQGASTRWRIIALVIGSLTFLVVIALTVLIDRAYGLNDALWITIWLGPPVVGGVTAALRPRNAVGWVLLAIGAVGVSSQFFFAYSPGPRPTDLQALVLALGPPILFLAILLVALLVLLFPTGTVAPGWRPRLVKFGAVVISLGVISSLFLPTLSGDAQNYHNPLGSPALDRLDRPVNSVCEVLVFLIMLVVCVDVVRRLRRARGIQRQQFKWLAYSSVLLLPAILVAIIGPGNWWGSVVPLVIVTTAMMTSIGLSIVRYRLYDIDRLVSRTVAYLLVVGVLFGVYVGSVLLMTTVLPLRGSVSVVIAVLIAVALFSPLRSRARSAVDKRFNRSRYDAQAVVDAFAVRLGGQVTLDAITTDLLTAVEQTVQPSHASLWLRGP